MTTGPKFLFVPVSGPGGAGEYYRSLAVARAAERRWPGCLIRFILSRDAIYADECPYPVLRIARSPTYETREVESILERERPDIVVFDSAGRVAQYRRAKQLGASVVFVSSRATTRRKGFRLRRMRWVDQHWIVAPRFAAGGLSAIERLRMRLAPHCEIVFLDVLYEPLDEAGTAELQRSLGVEPGAYLLACPGGGGVFGGGPDAAQVYFEAGTRLASESGLAVVAVMGPRFVPPASTPPGVRALASLPGSLLMGMLRDARVGIVNGGSLLLQAIALGVPCVAAPISEDQPARIAACAGQGLVKAAALDAASIVQQVSALLDAEERVRLCGRINELAVENGLNRAVQAIERLVPGRESSVQGARCMLQKRLRIMQVILSKGFAGSERAAAEACNVMCARHDVVLVIRSDHRSSSGASIRDHLDQRVEVIELPGRLGTRGRMAKAIRCWRPDVVHTHLRRGTRYVAQIGAGPAHFCTLHVSLNGPHYLQSDGIFCISEWQVATIPSDYRGRVFLLRNSLVSQPRIDAARVRQLRTEFGATEDDFVIGGVGRLTRGKGFDVLIRAFAAAALPAARLVIVGDGHQRWRLTRLASPNVVLVGFRYDVKDLYQVFDLFVSPSRAEPFGRVIIEALDAGTPVIATDCSGPRDIAPNLPIELVPAGDVAALAGALRRAAARPRQRIAVDLSEFNAERIVARMLAAYEEILATRSRPAQRDRSRAAP